MIHSDTEKLQATHFDKIAALYDAHYGDPCSLEYRRRFIYNPLFEGVPLNGKNVLEAMCGNGQAVEFLLNKGSTVIGLDISPEETAAFLQKWPDCQVITGSILESSIPDETYDTVVVIGGLHHMHPKVTEAVTEIHRILKKGGYFCFMEPPRASFVDRIRRFWYRRDPFCAENEASIDIDQLKITFSDRLQFNKEIYGGNIAYLLVFSSMFFRIPLRLKPYYAPFLMKLESVFGRLQGKLFSCFVLVQCQKL